MFKSDNNKPARLKIPHDPVILQFPYNFENTVILQKNCKKPVFTVNFPSFNRSSVISHFFVILQEIRWKITSRRTFPGLFPLFPVTGKFLEVIFQRISRKTTDYRKKTTTTTT